MLEVWALSSAFVGLSIFKECPTPSSPGQIGKVILDSKRGIKAYPDTAIFEDNSLKKSELNLWDPCYTFALHPVTSKMLQTPQKTPFSVPVNVTGV